jgi:hypothetical protein
MNVDWNLNSALTFVALAVTGRTIGQPLPRLELDELVQRLQLRVAQATGRHGEDLVSRMQVRRGVLMAFDAPAHEERVGFAYKRHLVHAPVTLQASDVLGDVHTVVEVDVVR